MQTYLGKEWAGLDEDQLWTVREGERGVGRDWVPAKSLSREATLLLRWSPEKGR